MEASLAGKPKHLSSKIGLTFWAPQTLVLGSLGKGLGVPELGKPLEAWASVTICDEDSLPPPLRV